MRTIITTDLGSQEGVYLLIEDDHQTEEDAHISHQGERRKVLQVSDPAKDRHWYDNDGYPRFCPDGYIKGLTKDLNMQNIIHNYAQGFTTTHSNSSYLTCCS